ncbi:MAG: T9SS type A sorting domain-containing protein, partial [Bacteroidota bacterium]
SDLLATQLQAPECAQIQDCEEAVELTVSEFGESSIWTSTTLGENEGPTEKWFRFTARNANDNILVRSSDPTFNGVIEIHANCTGQSLIGTFNNYGPSTIERAMAGGLIEGEEYYAFISHTGEGSGVNSFPIEVKHTTFAFEKVKLGHCDKFNFKPSDYLDLRHNVATNNATFYSNPAVKEKAFKLQLVKNGAVIYELQQQGNLRYRFDMEDMMSMLDWNTNYEVHVSHAINTQFNGQLGWIWSDMRNTGCEMAVGTAPNLALCGVLCSDDGPWSIQAYPFNNYADGYRIKFEGSNGNMWIEQMNSYALNLYEGDLELFEEYEVSVSILVDGSWTSYSESTCTIQLVECINGSGGNKLEYNELLDGQKEAQILLYPNPSSSDEFNLESDYFLDEERFVVTIFSMEGKEIYQELIEKHEGDKIRIRPSMNFSSGTYYVRVQCSSLDQALIWTVSK